MEPGKDEIGKIVYAMQLMLQSITEAEEKLKQIALTDSLPSHLKACNRCRGKSCQELIGLQGL